MQKYITYTTDICNGICWHFIQYCYCLPHLLAAIFHDDNKTREGKLVLVKGIYDSVLKVEDFIVDGCPGMTKHEKDALVKKMNLLAWNKTQVAREGCGVCRAADWKYADPELRAFVFSLYARPATTIYHLENVFNHLSTIIKRLRKNAKINRSMAATIIDAN